MTHTTIKTAFAALIAATAMSSTISVDEAHAKYKVKEMKFHFVQGAYEDTPVLEMKYSSGKWNWVNQSDSFKPRLKVYYKANAKTRGRVLLDNMGVIWQMPSGYYAKSYEKLITLNVGKTVLASYKNQAAAACDVFGKDKKVVRDFNIGATFDVWREKTAQHKYKNGSFPIKVVCHAKPDGPTRNPNTSSNQQKKDLKLTKLKIYTIPAKPKCGKPVKMVGEFHTNEPGKIEFMYVRGDGAKQNASVVTTKTANGFSKRWAKTYKFNETTFRKYMIIVKGHPASTNWKPLKVHCGGSFKS